MKRLIVFTLMLLSLKALSQYSSYNGADIYPIDTFRVLNIFINIIYDQTEDRNPIGVNTDIWQPGPPNSVNFNPPSYLLNFMDADIDPGNIYNGSMTRYLNEASFNQFLLLGDFVVVNITQSKMKPYNPGASFSDQALSDTAISLINQNGGLTTLYGHNCINDYDTTSRGSWGKIKPKCGNGKIDYVQFLVRNPVYKKDSAGNLEYTYGGHNTGGGHTPHFISYKHRLIIGDTVYQNEAGSYQGVGNTDLSEIGKFPVIHELAHNLLGGNEFHMGGGYHTGTYGYCVQMGAQGGWAMLGGANSSLITCNGFERWRLNWREPDNNSYEIAAGNNNSDIKKSDGDTSFILRDFITYGDVIRIKLPYKDIDASNQYIWLENHQLHNNEKFDYLRWWEVDCRDDGLPGIYAYYQIGKDILHSNTYSDVYHYYDVDNLIILSAEGNWDMSLLPGESVKCVNYSDDIHRKEEYNLSNPFGGYNDQQYHIFNEETEIINYLQKFGWAKLMWIKVKDGEVYPGKLPSNGDDLDPFTGNSEISISTNPSPFNVITYYVNQWGDDLSIPSNYEIKNNRKTHLSGLRIQISDQEDETFKVDISWNYYDVNSDVRWTGDIVLHEELNLLYETIIILDQNYTPNKHIRDPVTGVFVGPTYFTCLENSFFKMQYNSDVILQNLSSFILEPGSKLEINTGAALTVKSGCTFYMQSGAELVIKGSGKIEVESGGYICIAPNVNITLQDNLSVINLNYGYNTGVNTDVLSNPGNCVSDVANYSISGNGSINTFNDDVYIQDTTFTEDEYVAGKNIFAGSNVDPTQDPGPVKVKNGAEVIFNAQQEVIIEGDFEIEAGGEFKIEE